MRKHAHALGTENRRGALRNQLNVVRPLVARAMQNLVRHREHFIRTDEIKFLRPVKNQNANSAHVKLSNENANLQ
jgi:hypothetical protein